MNVTEDAKTLDDALVYLWILAKALPEEYSKFRPALQRLTSLAYIGADYIDRKGPPVCYNDPRQTTFGGECAHGTCIHHAKDEPICTAGNFELVRD